MVLGSMSTQVTGSNFSGNDINLGDCAGGTVTATGCWFDTSAYDGTCAGQTESMTAAQPVAGAGLLPLPPTPPFLRGGLNRQDASGRQGVALSLGGPGVLAVDLFCVLG
jgi:hypothetical protein